LVDKLNEDSDPIGMGYYSKTEGIVSLDFKGEVPITIKGSKECVRYEGIYQIGLYYTEALYIVVKFANDTLKVKGFINGDLNPHPNRKDVFSHIQVSSSFLKMIIY
jgi:hypothetical protein